MASFGGLGDSVLAPEAVEDLDGEPVGARDFVLTALSPGEQDYQIGVLEFDQFAGSSCSLVCIAVLDNKLLVAVPQEVWSRTVSQRLLNPKGLTKPFLCSVAAKPVGAEEGSEALNCKAWVGFLQGELENRISFPEFPEVTFGFGPSDGPPLLPVKGALLEVSNDHFVFQTGESATGAAEGEEEKVHGRLKVLEDSLLEIQRSLSVLTSQPSVGGVPTARPGGIPGGPVGISVKPTSKAKPQKPAAKSGLVRGALTGLDPAVVDAALSAGVPEKHLVEMAQVLKQRPSRMDDAPQTKSRAAWTPMEESEEEEEPEATGGETGESGQGSDEVSRALSKLTQICSTLVEQKQKKGDLEHLLDGSGLASSSESSSVPSARRNAAALRALQRALRENPRFIYQSVEANLLSDFHSHPMSPGEPLGIASARGWLTSRSRIQNFTAHVRWSWQVAGIWDALIRGASDEARARCSVLLAAADQSAIDGGSWVLGNVALLEGPPPYQAFATHSAPSHQELQHSTLLDPRWIEVFLGHVKEQDSYMESKKKLSKGGGKGGAVKDGDQGGVGDPNPKKGAKAKKAARGEGGAASET